LICVEKKYASRIEKYFKSFFKPLYPTGSIDLVVFAKEEESISAIRYLGPLVSTDCILMEGSSLLDIPLDEIQDTHRLCGSSITMTLKEFDMSKTGKGPKMADVGQSDIFGISTWTPEQIRMGQQNQH